MKAQEIAQAIRLAKQLSEHADSIARSLQPAVDAGEMTPQIESQVSVSWAEVFA